MHPSFRSSLPGRLASLSKTALPARAVAALGLILMACGPVAAPPPGPGQEHAALGLAQVALSATPGWYPTAPMNQVQGENTATLLRNGKLLVHNTSGAELYDPDLQTWTTTGALAVARSTHTTTLLPDGTVLVVGGLSARTQGERLASCELYNPFTGTWSLAGALNEARFYHTATLLPDGRVLVTGGINSSGNPSASYEVYDPATHTWSAAGSLSEARSGHTATLLPDGKVLIVGGGASHSEVYDPATRLSSLMGPPGASSRSGHTATLLPDGTVLVTGGILFNPGGETVFLSSSELYAPATHTWSSAGSLADYRSGHTATPLPNGTVLVVGGNAHHWGSCRDSTEVYDPFANRWFSSARLPEPRCGQSATVLNSGQVLVAGGVIRYPKSSSTPLSSVLLFAPRELKTSFSEVPANPTNQATATFAFSTSETGTHFVCSLDEAAFQPCASPLTTPPLSEGSHSLRVQARDAAGNVEAVPATHTWTVDTVPPGVGFASTPEPETRLPIPTFSFSTTEPGATFECSLDEAPFAACPGVFPALGDGQHRLTVRARDEAGNVGAPAWYSWKVDTVKPTLPVLQEPTPGQEFFTSRPRFWGTAEPGATVTLLVDGIEDSSVRADAQGTWNAVPGSALSWGEHRVSALATDGAGNSSGPIPEVPFFTSRRADDGWGCSTSPSSWQASWPWALLLLGLLRPRARKSALPARAVAALGLVLVACSPLVERSTTQGQEHEAVKLAQGATLAPPGWSQTYPLSQPRQAHTATLLRDGTVLVMNGWTNSSSPSSSAELYDPATQIWSTASVPPVARTRNTATLLPDGKVLVTGGYAPPAGHLSSSDVYDPGTRTWSTVGSLISARSWHTATLLPDGKVLVTGGFNGGVLSSCEVYDPDTRTWSTAGSLLEARDGHTATLLLDGRVLIVGGRNASGKTANNEVYDPATGTSSVTGPPIHFRQNHTATLLRNGKVLVAGGTNNVDIYLKSSELYDPATGTWSAAGPLNDYRFGHTATPLGNGTVLIVGGSHPSAVSPTSTEVYEPASNQWLVGAPLLQGRGEHSATLLNSARVLVVGGSTVNGYGSTYRTLSSVELWTPRTLKTSFDKAPATPTPQTRATFTFSGNETGLSFVCSLDEAAFAPCTSPSTIPSVPEGPHTLRIQARDTAGNVETPPASHSWVFDPRTPLETAILTAPSPRPTRATTATFTFDSNDAEARFECSLDEAPFSPCSGPAANVALYEALADGAHTFRVRARDAAGNVDTTPDTRSWLVDTVPPDTHFGSTPPPDTSLSIPSFSFSSEPRATFECSLDGAPFSDCPHVFPALDDGDHQLAVRARDEAGNLDFSPARYPWTVDTVPPLAPSLLEPSPGQTLRTATPRFSGTAEPGATVTLFIDGHEASAVRADDQGVWSAVPDAALSWGKHRVSARATDKADNLSPPLPLVSFSTSRRGNYGMGCSAGPSSLSDSWPWALMLLALLRPRARPRRGGTAPRRQAPARSSEDSPS